MWACFNDGFLSMVADRNDPKMLMIRARKKAHISNVFPKAVITESPKADYRWRTRIDRVEVSAMMTQRIMGINYDNFKNSVEDHELHDAYNNVWSVMYRLQNHVRHLVGAK